jgi:DNA anti-recombination protein RmuC
MKKGIMLAVVFSAFSSSFNAVYADTTQLTGTVDQQMQQLNNQLQKQMKEAQDLNQQQLDKLNAQVQNQIKQLQEQLQTQIQTVNSQTQSQIAKVQAALQQQIKTVHEEVMQNKK